MMVLRLIWNLIVQLQRWFIIIGGCIITVLVFIEVMLRYVFESPLFGIEEMIVFIAMWLYFLGASLGAYDRTHIKADVIYVWVKTPRSMAVVATINSIVTVILSAILTSWSYDYIVFSFQRGGSNARTSAAPSDRAYGGVCRRRSDDRVFLCGTGGRFSKRHI